MSTAAVYVPAPSRENLRIGVDQSIWGWKPETVSKGDTAHVLAGLGAGDYLLLGHKGPNARVAKGGWAQATLKELIVAQVRGPVFQGTDAVWPDELYPTRIRLEILDRESAITAQQLGAEAMEALRLSANKQGAPVLISSTGTLEHLVAATADPVLDADGPVPVQERYIDLPGDLDRVGTALVRREQQRLRKKKFGNAALLGCALCGRMLPARMVHTAHVKRRSLCSIDERRDLENIMGACVLGCDALFEEGYVYIDAAGLVQPSARASDGGDDLDDATALLKGRSCTAFAEPSEPYFGWHRRNIAGCAQ